MQVYHVALLHAVCLPACLVMHHAHGPAKFAGQKISVQLEVCDGAADWEHLAALFVPCHDNEAICSRNHWHHCKYRPLKDMFFTCRFWQQLAFASEHNLQSPGQLQVHVMCNPAIITPTQPYLKQTPARPNQTPTTRQQTPTDQSDSLLQT